MIDSKIIFELLGGLAILLFGINLLGASLQSILGSRLEVLLKKTDKNPLKGLAIGAGITSIIQSSGTTNVILVGFISAGLLSLESAIPVMLGASIGSTITTQLAAFHLGYYALPILTAGFLVYIVSFRRIYENLGQAVIGLSFLFLGINFIFEGVESLSLSSSTFVVANAVVANSVFSVIVAAIFTFLIRSSSAASVFVVALGVAHIINLNSALFLILGVNLGSSIKIVYMALRGKSFSGRIALLHLIFNLFGLFLFFILFKYFQQIVALSSGDVGRQIANAHTLYNLITALIFIPFIPFLVKFVSKYFSRRKIKKSKLFYLDKKLLYTPSVALNQVNKAIAEMAKIAYEMLEDARIMFIERKTSLFEGISKGEQEIDELTGKISEYTIQVSQQNLTQKDSMKLYSLMHILTDIEHLSDHILTVAKLLVNLEKNNIKFSEKAEKELAAIFGKLKMMQNLVIKSLEEDNLSLAYEIIMHENKVDEIVKKSHYNHMERLNRGICSLDSGRYFSELLNNLERVGDHSDNIAYAVVDRFKYK